MNKRAVMVAITASSTTTDGPESLRMGSAPEIDTVVPGGFAPPIRAGQTVDGKGHRAFATRDI